MEQHLKPLECDQIISRRDSSSSEVVLVPSKFGDGATCMRALCEGVVTTRRIRGQPWTHRGKQREMSILIRVYTRVYTLGQAWTYS